MSEGEIWKDIVGYEGLYKVSNRGNVYSVERKYANGKKRDGLTLKPRYTRDGYLLVDLHKNGTRETKYIHRLVLEAFVENPSNFPEVNHLDEVKDNNELSNLEWCDRRYNINYGMRNERISKEIRAINIKTGEVATFSSIKEATTKGYSRSGVSEACRGVYHTTGHLYKGHRWYYMREGEQHASQFC